MVENGRNRDRMIANTMIGSCSTTVHHEHLVFRQMAGQAEYKWNPTLCAINIAKMTRITGGFSSCIFRLSLYTSFFATQALPQ